ncbi:MAG: hypothetical protein BWX84_03053 [Verrucomicrobia bacterium ADurb.Bin118]|jgi:hypothetical protein|nr:MAG: hypothetical protein BWX84_03053 [Verrucomicrobia bacterium ADurb.Bin118]
MKMFPWRLAASQLDAVLEPLGGLELSSTQVSQCAAKPDPGWG